MKAFAICACIASCSVGLAQQAGEKPKFEVAAVKASDPNPENQIFIGMSADGALVKYTNITLRDCIRGAYRVRDFQIIGPDWMTKARFEINAKLPTGASADQIPEMLQALLEERFKLEIRRDTQEQNVYALTVGNGGAKLKPAEVKADDQSPKAQQVAEKLSLSNPGKVCYAWMYMRGDDIQQNELFSYGSLDERVPEKHPLRAIRTMVDEALREMSGRFDEIYPEEGRRSIPPERLLRALLLQMLYSVRSERMLMEQLEYNLLFRWFVGLSANEPVWHPTVFTKNRDRLLEGAVAEQFFSLIVRQARNKKLLSDEHFTVDGTLVEAWAGQKSFQRKDSGDDPLNPPPPDRGSNPTINWHKEKRSNETHESLTDPMARLYKKTRGAEARLGYLGHVLTENRNGLVVDVRLTQASGTAEREAAEAMISGKPKSRSVTLAGDRGYDTRSFVATMRELNVTPHVAQNDSNRRSAIDGRTTRHTGYAISQRKRKRVEEVFGWIKTVALQRKTRFRGVERVGWMFTLAASAYNLVRMRNLQAATA